MNKIKAREKIFIVDTIRKFFPDSIIWEFGSRIAGTAKKCSDLDCSSELSKGKLSASKFLDLQTCLAESDLPFKVDISDFSVLREEFKKNGLNKAEKC